MVTSYKNMNQLHDACKKGDLEEVTSLLSNEECEVNAHNIDGESPLHIVCRYGHLEIVKVLLMAQQCDFNIQNVHGDTPLHIACNSKSLLDIVRLLLQRRCSTYVTNRKGETAQDIILNEDGDRLLHIACQWGDVDIVGYLITGERFNPSVQNKTSDTPLHVAIEQGKTAVVSQLLANQQCDLNVQNKDGDTPLHTVAELETIVQLLSYKECNPNIQNSEGDTPLHSAIRQGKTAVVSRLLTYQQCDPNVQNKDGDTPLHIAVKNNTSYTTHRTPAVHAISHLLTNKRCNPSVPNKDGDTPLHIAIRHYQEDTVFLMSLKECDVNVQNKDGDIPLHIACYRKSFDTVKFLLKRKCTTNIHNKDGETAQDILLNKDEDCLLHIACQWGDVNIVRYLITDERFNPSVQISISENTPLHIAAKYGQDKTIVQLLSKECNPNIQNSEGDTPLHSAIRQGKTAVVSCLLTYQQCDPNVQKKDGDTPLHIAVKNNTSYTTHRTPAVHAISHLLTNKRCNPNVPNKKGDTPIHIACYRNLFDIVKLLLKWKCDTNIPNKEGETAQDIPLNEDGDRLLHIACQWGDVDIVRYLITDERCNPSVQSFISENTPLHISCYRKSLDIIKLLLEWKCNTNIPNQKGETAQDIPLNEDGDCLLHIACQWGDVDIVRYLITNERCNPNILNSHLNTPMHIACYKKFLSVIRLLIENKCRTDIFNQKYEIAHDIPLNENGDHLLHIACHWGDEDIVRCLITDKKCDVNIQNTCQNTPLHTACYVKSLSIIKLFLEMRCSTNIPNKKGETAQDISLNEDGDHLLHIACQWGDVDIVRYLIIDESFNPSVQNSISENTPLHIAAKYGQDDTIVQLLSYKECNPNAHNKKGDTPLHVAIKQGKTALVSQLLADQQCDPNVQNKDGDTPLHLAIMYNRTTAISQLLLYTQCDPNVQNKEGDTPLHTAAEHGQDETIVQLLSYKECNPNIQNSEGDTPLHSAIRQGKTAVVSRLLTYQQCDPNVQNKDGDTTLHIAVKNNTSYTTHRTPAVHAISHLLTNKRCNPSVPNKDGDTPLHIAIRHWQDDTVFLMSLKECDVNVQNKEGDTPLHIACYRKSFDTVKLLLKRKCSTNILNQKGETTQDILLNEDGDCLLHIACQWGDVNIVRYLITDESFNPNVQSSTSENTPLHISCYRKSLDIIKLLLEWKCNTNIPNQKGETAQDIPLNEDGDCLLHIACQWGDVDIVRYLITNERCNPNILNSHLNTPMHIACYKKFLSVIRLLIENKCRTDIFNQKYEIAHDIPLNENGDHLLHIACHWGDEDIVRCLITDKKCDVNIQNTCQNTPLHTACYVKSLSIIKLFLEMRCSTNIPNKKGETAQDIPLNVDGDRLLHIACQWGDVDIVRYLIIDENCNPNVQSSTTENTPLHIATKYGQDDTIVQLLFHRKCNPNIKNIEGDTPLHIACYRKSLGVVKLLLQRGCSTNIPNKNGETARDIPLNEDGDRLLHLVCQWGDVDIIRYIVINDHCNLRIQNDNLETPLHIACYQKSLSIIKFFLEMRCSTNVPNKKGETAQDIPLNEGGDCLLHIACQWGDVDIVRYLITDQKCNPNIQNLSKNTPLHIAVKHCQTDLISQLLSSVKCDPNIQNKDGDTPLHIAVRDNVAATIFQVLQHYLNIQNSVVGAMLHATAAKDRTPVVSLLSTNGKCNPNIVNKDHLTPLLIAIKHNNHAAATALLQHNKCDATLCDPHGNTPLHLACIGGENHPQMVEVAKQLLGSVNPSCVNNAGQTPIELTTNYQLIQAISSFVKYKTEHSVQTYINVFIVGNPKTGKSTLVKAICKEATSILWKIVPKQARRVKNVPLHTAGIIPTKFQSKTFGNTVLYDLAGQVEYYSSHAAVIQSTVISTPPAFIVVVNLSESDEKIIRTLRYWWSFIDNHAARSSAPPQVILIGSYADIVKSTGKSAQEKLTQMSALLKQMSNSFHFAGQVPLDCRDPASRKLQHLCFLVNQSCTVLRQSADVDLRCHVLYAFLLERFKGKVACTVSEVAISVKENRELLPQNSAHLVPLISTLSDKGLLFLVKGGERYADWWIILQKQALLGEMNGVIFAPKGFRQHKDLSWSTGVVPFSKLKNEFPDYNPNMVSEFLVHLEFCFKIEDHETLALLKDEAEDTSPDVSEEYYFFPALVSIENPLHVWEQNDAMCWKCGWYYRCIRPDQFLTTQFLHVLILRLAFTFALKLDQEDCREDSLAIRRKCSVWKHGIAWLNGASIETVVEVGLQYQSVIVMMHCPTGKEAKCVQLRSEVIQKVLQVKDEHCKAVKMSESFIHPTDVNYPFTQDDFEDVKFYSFTGIARTIIKGEENALDQRGRHPIPVHDLLLFDPDTSTELLRELFSEKHSMDETVRSQALKALNGKVEKCKFSVPHMPRAWFFFVLHCIATSQPVVIQGVESEETSKLRTCDATVMSVLHLLLCYLGVLFPK